MKLPSINWDEWRGTLDGQEVMLIKQLFAWKGWRIDLHGFVGSDLPGCFHTHPAWAFRLILWGGYIEELESGERRLWFPGRFGFVSPRLSHRVATPIYTRAYTLWIRSPKKHEVQLRGGGWPVNEHQ